MYVCLIGIGSCFFGMLVSNNDLVVCGIDINDEWIVMCIGIYSCYLVEFGIILSEFGLLVV